VAGPTPGRKQPTPTQHVLGAGGLDDDLRAQRGDTHIHARVAVLCKLADEQLVQLRVEDAIGDELRR